MKRVHRVVVRYSSRYEKTLPDGSLRRPMELRRSPHARPQRNWTTQDPRSSRDPKRLLLPPRKRLPVVALASPRLPRVAHRLPLHFRRWRIDGTWERINRATRQRLRVRLGRDLQPRVGVVDGQSVKTSAVGGEERGFDGGKKVKGRKRHIMVDTEGFVLSRRRSTAPR
jgi:transposase